MAAHHDLPLDVLRLLLEFSASTSLKTARTLSLVSKNVQHWTDPHLYRIVEGDSVNYSRSERYGVPSVERLCSSGASPRIVLARHYVRAVTWELNVQVKSLIKTSLHNFPNLVQLCLWNDIFPFRSSPSTVQSDYLEITQSYSSLKRVATCIYDTSTTPPNAFGSPFWMSITHLQVKYYHPISSSKSPFQLPLFIAMSSLTHLALTFMALESEHDTGLAFSRIRGTFPPSLILCLFDLAAPKNVDPGTWFTEMAYAGLKVDDRIVLCSGVPGGNADEMVVISLRDTFQEWCAVQDGVQTFWELGESVLKGRRGILRTA